MALTAGLSLLTLLALQAVAQEPLYFEIGKNLTLDPKPSEAITAITWKHNENIVAEYIKDNYDLNYLGDLKGRLKLDVATGVLTVSNMSKSDDGEFTVEINQKVFPVKFNVVGVRKLDTVEVILRPLTCSSKADHCFLDCGEEFKDAEPVQYSWKKGETGEWQEGNKRLVISKETEQVETFTCRAENLFSNVTSDPHNNPYCKKHEGSSVLVAVIVLLLILAAVAGGIAWLVISKPPCVINLLKGNSEQPTENRKELETLNANSSPESGVNPGAE